MLTRAADYAVRVMIYLATLPAGTRVQRTALAQEAEVPESFMSKVLQDLVRARFIASRSGLHGGFELTASPQKLTLLDVVEAIDGPVAVNLCVGAGARCERQRWCASHLVWEQAQQAFTDVLSSATIARLAEQTIALRTSTVRFGKAGDSAGNRPRSRKGSVHI